MATPIDKATHVLLAEHFDTTRSVLLTSTDPDIDVDEVGKELEKIDDVEKIVKRGNDFLVQFVSESGVVDIGEIVSIGENITLAMVIPTPKTQSTIRLEELEAALKKSEEQRTKSEEFYLRDRKMWEEQMTRMKVVELDQPTLRLLQTHQHHQCLCMLIKVPMEMAALYKYLSVELLVTPSMFK